MNWQWQWTNTTQNNAPNPLVTRERYLPSRASESEIVGFDLLIVDDTVTHTSKSISANSNGDFSSSSIDHNKQEAWMHKHSRRGGEETRPGQLVSSCRVNQVNQCKFTNLSRAHITRFIGPKKNGTYQCVFSKHKSRGTKKLSWFHFLKGSTANAVTMFMEEEENSFSKSGLWSERQEADSISLHLEANKPLINQSSEPASICIHGAFKTALDWTEPDSWLNCWHASEDWWKGEGQNKSKSERALAGSIRHEGHNYYHLVFIIIDHPRDFIGWVHCFETWVYFDDWLGRQTKKNLEQNKTNQPSNQRLGETNSNGCASLCMCGCSLEELQRESSVKQKLFNFNQVPPTDRTTNRPNKIVEHSLSGHLTDTRVPEFECTMLPFTKYSQKSEFQH